MLSSDKEEKDLNDFFQFTRDLKMKNVLYSALPVEYPPTTDEGVAIIFSLKKNSSADALHTKAADFFHDVRFIIINKYLLSYQNF